MKVRFARELGFCFGVRRAVEKAMSLEGEGIYCHGELIHNQHIIQELERRGIATVQSIDDVPNGARLIVRSHGVGKDIYSRAASRGINLIDATCPVVSNIHKIVARQCEKGKKIIIIGSPSHAEVEGIMGWCADAVVVWEENQLLSLDADGDYCMVCQTTFSVEKFKSIQVLARKLFKTVEIFDTICYTTSKRQTEAKELAQTSSLMLVVGSAKSSNTVKLKDLCERLCHRTFLIQTFDDLQSIKFLQSDRVGVVAGASTPDELIREVQKHMAQKIDNSKNFDVNVSSEFAQGVEESFVQYRVGARKNCAVISADEAGIKVIIGGKNDAFINADEVCFEGEYNPQDYKAGDEFTVEIIDTAKNEQGLLLVSKKKVDRDKESNKIVETIRDGSVFEITPTKDVGKGVLAELGSYSVFIPASHLKRVGYETNLKGYLNHPIRVVILEIDDEKRKIKASAKKVLEAEYEEKSNTFWSKLEPGIVVSGKVKRATSFGAFVSVDGFDCLAHIGDLAWYKINKVEEVLTIGETYDFVILSADREKNRVSLGYKQLQKHPFEIVTSKYAEGNVVKGKVVRLVPFGAFVNIETGVDGLVHVSEASHNFVKNINEVLKVGDEVEAKITKIDFDSHKISLSIKALLPEVEQVAVPTAEEEVATAEEAKAKTEAKLSRFKDIKKTPAKAAKKTERDDGPRQWSEEAQNNPFADLLKDFPLEDEKNKK